MDRAAPWLAAVPEPFSVAEAQRTTVSYFVITDSTREGLGWLPFFSGLNLMLRARDLRRSGFRVTINRIGFHDASQVEGLAK